LFKIVQVLVQLFILLIIRAGSFPKLITTQNPFMTMTITFDSKIILLTWNFYTLSQYPTQYQNN